MSDRLPPLTSLRAFDAAARQMSFSKAAEELNVTPAALSYQIKSLEDHLGAPLFRRLNRAVELTEAGEMLAAGVGPAFAALQNSWREVRRRADSPLLVVTAGPAITAKWLAPNLYTFAAAHPEIDLRLTASLNLLDLDRDGIDVAIRFGPVRQMPGSYVQPIIDEWVTPMMRPDLAASLNGPEDLRDMMLLHQEDISRIEPDVSWSTWFRAAGLGDAPPVGPRFSQSDHAIDAAILGGGVVLGRISLTANDLKAGRLVAPFPTALSLQSQTRLVCREGKQDTPSIRTFIDWIVELTQIDQAFAENRTFVAASDVAGR
ncbi:MAG: transcriptional regulator GcvA [Pseudomonadota bacterium]